MLCRNESRKALCWVGGFSNAIFLCRMGSRYSEICSGEREWTGDEGNAPVSVSIRAPTTVVYKSDGNEGVRMGAVSITAPDKTGDVLYRQSSHR